MQFTPWWWEWAPRRECSEPGESGESGESGGLGEAGEPRLPSEAEVAVIGSGFTALSAALTLAREGREVVVIEAGAPGFGASTRNGGQVGSGNQRFTVRALIARFGEAQARALLAEGVAALGYVGDLIETEQIDCHFQRVGRFRGANHPAHLAPLIRDMQDLSQAAGVEFHPVSRADQASEIGTDLYHGGVVLPNDASVHPGLYHQGLLERVEAAGVKVVAHTTMLSLHRERQRVAVRTTRGELSAGAAIVATNGYTGRATPEFEQRVLPIGSAIIATEVLPESVMARIMPRQRVIGETRRIFYYYRVSPDGKRILFGGRVGRIADPPRGENFIHLYRGLLEIFPELEGTRITHGWTGYTGYTQDTFPHAGERDGIHYALGYCGSGVARATHLGHKIALRVLGDPDGHTAWDAHAFEAFPFPRAARTFLPAAVAWYRLRDRLNL